MSDAGLDLFSGSLSGRDQFFLAGVSAFADAEGGVAVPCGTPIRMPQARQRTVLPRAICGTDRIERHLRFGQIRRTELDMSY